MRGFAGKALLVSILALPCLGGSAAAAIPTGGALTPGATPTKQGSAPGAPAAEPAAGNVTLASARANPRKAYYFGFRYPRLSFTIASDQPQNDLQIDVLDATGAVVRSFFRNDVAPGVATAIRWDGTTAEGRPARKGSYAFRVVAQGAAVAARLASTSGAEAFAFDFYGYAFPILGDHEYSLSAGRFGAGRDGHTHQGQDVMAACGLPLVAARGGQVRYSGYQAGGAGNYIVIDGKGTRYDFMYAHLAEPSPLLTGESVRTGQPIGLVGTTGSSSGCHLHFEMWEAPGWYEGGSPFDPLLFLQRWDRYS
ncbi:MAG TPA: peptidoglycan DD-metalloendopeptidase family protein [Solirubrobacterales bacterium]|nr:peptidoglycan DD-metalloendopeptidase family protein [Solirubrobacterales bacterium]